VTVSDPAGAKSTLKPAVDERGAVLTLESPQRAGFYRLALADGGTDVFAVNRDTGESDLKALDREAVKKLLPVREYVWIGLNEDLLSALTRSRQGVELWRHLLIAALLLMVIETGLAQLFGRRA
jgi:hypothetical protein